MPAIVQRTPICAETAIDAIHGLALNRAFDLQALASEFRTTGRVRIPAFLGTGASELSDYLLSTDEWIQVINEPGGVIELELDEWVDLPRARKTEIQNALYARASRGFQYSYAAIRIPGPIEQEEDETLLGDFSRFMDSKDLLSTVEAIIGSTDLAFTDGQATAYGVGDFLTGHDDNVPGRNRVAAFVLGMTPLWRLEWGGLLIFHPTPSADALALVPAFNTLDLFAVPALHSVSQVMPCAEGPRHALTGWLSRSAQA